MLATGLKKGIEPGLPILLQLSPRGILFGPIPVLRERFFAQQRSFGGMSALFIFENCDERTASRRQVSILEYPHTTFLVDHSFKGAYHCLILISETLRIRREGQKARVRSSAY